MSKFLYFIIIYLLVDVQVDKTFRLCILRRYEDRLWNIFLNRIYSILFG